MHRAYLVTWLHELGHATLDILRGMRAALAEVRAALLHPSRLLEIDLDAVSPALLIAAAVVLELLLLLTIFITS